MIFFKKNNIISFQFYKKNFLLINISKNIILKLFFLSLNNLKINFDNPKLSEKSK